MALRGPSRPALAVVATRTLAVCLFVRAPQLLARSGLPAVLAATLLAGCVSMGPRSVRLERTAYNRAVTETQEEELLLNLVRARYMRGVSFLEIASISSSLSVEAGVGGTVGASTVAGGDFAIGALVYADQPTIIYQPVSGELFVRQLLTPLSQNSIALLIAGGFDTADVFQVFASQINGLLNARIDADAGTSATAAYEDFDRAISLLEALVARNAIITGAIGPDADSLFVRLTTCPPDRRRVSGGQFSWVALKRTPGTAGAS